MDNLLIQKLLLITDSITRTIIAKSPIALQLLYSTVRIEAISSIMYGFISLLCLIIYACVIRGILAKISVLYNNAKVEYEKTHSLQFDFTDAVFPTLLYICVFMLGFSLVLFFMSTFFNVLNLFNWVAIWHPDIYLTHELLEKISSPGRC